tara:strand:+ start:18011 stop:18469 length:459 start_codon:yes stop_codon:yes gene_type:complete
MDIRLRSATEKDTQLIFDWRNNPKTRQFSIDSSELSWKNHCTWIKAVIQNPYQQLLIAEQNSSPIGVLRFDVSENTIEITAMISIFLDPNRIHRGLGTTIIQQGCDWLKSNHPNIAMVTAHILPENIASKKAFIKCGFEEKKNHFELKLPKN